MRLNDDLLELQTTKVGAIENSHFDGPRSVALHLVYTAMWREGLYALIATLLASCALVLPLFWRDRNKEVVRVYEQHKMDVNRDALTRAHTAASFSISRMKVGSADGRLFMPELDFEPPLEKLDPREDTQIVVRTRAAFETLHSRFLRPAEGVVT